MDVFWMILTLAMIGSIWLVGLRVSHRVCVRKPPKTTEQRVYEAQTLVHRSRDFF